MTKIIFRLISKLILPLIARLEIHGTENLQIDDGFIIAANHLGQLDSALIFFLIERNDLMYLVNDKYKNYPLLGRLIASLGGIYIKRNAQNLGALRKALEHTNNGGILIITPEGIRSPTGTLQKGKPGVSFLACKLDKPIVPVGITGTEDKLVVSNLKHLRRSHITVKVGNLFNVPPLKQKTVFIENMTDEIMCQIAALLPEGYRGVYGEHPRLKLLLKNLSFN